MPVMLGLLSVFSAGAVAQEPHHPEISIAHPGIDQLKADVKLMLGLSTEDEEHEANWNDVIDLFADGQCHISDQW